MKAFFGSIITLFLFGCGNPFSKGKNMSTIEVGHFAYNPSPTPYVLPPAKSGEFVASAANNTTSTSQNHKLSGAISNTGKEVRIVTSGGHILYGTVEGSLISK